MSKLIKELESLQNETINIVRSVAEKDYHQQFHPDLSPMGWHLGHCIYIESYWIKEKLLGKQSIDESLKSLYVPELSVKQSRGSALPDKCELLEWASVTQSENRAVLESVSSKSNTHQLLKNDYLFHFLIQHYSQHIETMHMVLTEMQIQNSDSKFAPSKILKNNNSKKDFVTIEAEKYSIGSDDQDSPYDNEHLAHIIELDSFNIATSPVSNSEYLEFMNVGGYSKKDYWSDDGWEWCNNKEITHPHHWRLQNNSAWYGINHEGPFSLEEDHPIHGLNHFEAEAYAKWAGGRLPHEYEWEVANSKQRLQQTSVVWEWCKNTFHPYVGFSPYPYEGYSVPYFDDKHYILRGGSSYTKDHIKRPSFRNYYTADKRHIFAGIRLVYT
jgi:ergothioneine biosynthesis protein EgtB